MVKCRLIAAESVCTGPWQRHTVELWIWPSLASPESEQCLPDCCHRSSMAARAVSSFRSRQRPLCSEHHATDSCISLPSPELHRAFQTISSADNYLLEVPPETLRKYFYNLTAVLHVYLKTLNLKFVSELCYFRVTIIDIITPLLNCAGNI